MPLASAGVVQTVQRLCNLRHDITSAVLQRQPSNPTSKPPTLRYAPRHGIRAGWYMLSTAGSASSVAKQLIFNTISDNTFGLFVTAKPLTKRVVYIPETSPWLDISCDNDLAVAGELQLSLVKVTAQFAVSRMTRKLYYASEAHADSSLLSPPDLYDIYTRRFEVVDINTQYPKWYAHHRNQLQAAVKPTSCATKQLTLIRTTDEICTIELLKSCSTPFLCLIGDEVSLDDCFMPFVEQALLERPELMLLYTDHDVMGADTIHREPCFKPAWNPEMLLGGNYIGQVVVVSRNFFDVVGMPDLSLGSSCIYDLLLRALPVLEHANVHRLAGVLYSYTKAKSGSDVYFSVGDHDRVVRERYINKHLPQISLAPGMITGTQSVMWQLPATEPSVDIIIPSKDKVEMLRTCVESVFEKTRYKNFTITVVDNASVEAATYEYYQSMRANPRFNLLTYDGDFNYSGMNNYAVEQTHHDILVLLNNDTEVIDNDWLANMVAQAIRPQVGCVGAKLVYANGLIQHAGVIVGLFGMAGHAHRLIDQHGDGYCGRLKVAHNVSAVTAACLAVRRDVYQQVGQLDEVNLKVAYNDVDFCLRVLEAGYQNIWTPHAQLFHYESVSRGSEDTLRKRRRFQAEFAYMQSRWFAEGFSDIAYNPYLARDAEDFSLAA